MQRPAPRVPARPVFRLFAILSALALITGQVAASPRFGPSAAEADAQQAPAGGSDIEGSLLKKLEIGETDRFVVEFAAEADLSEADEIESFRGRGQFVVDALKGAARAQGEAIGIVRRTEGARAESFWLRNTLIVSGDAALAERLAALPGVERVRAERVYPLVKPVETEIAVLAEGLEPEWGVAKIGADGVWETGVTGSGVVVANIDTGVDFEHPALVNQYRGNLGGGELDHNYSWWDPTGICGDAPCDNAEHGTHTMGTMVGGDGPGPFTPDVGVAPGARWIAAKGCEDFSCSEGALLSSGQFILAPTDLNGDNEDVTKRADIVNNSWGSGPGDEFYLDVVRAWRAAGIVPVFSAGNSGPGCDSGGSPGDFLESFSVGATDADDLIADFSSRGPSVFGKGNPDVSAPGVDVVSTVPGGGYAAFSGTSMAAPHVAGTLALIMSAEIGLAGQVDAATAALRDTALDILDDQCGGDEDGDPNNVYGDGRIDAAAAVALVATGGTLAGTVTDSASGDPIGGASISAYSGTRTFTTTSAADGSFDLFLAAGTYAVTASAFGYAMGSAEAVEIVTDETTTQDFGLVALPRHTVSGVVTAASDGAPIEGARVTAVGTPVTPAVTNPNGVYELVLPEGSYLLRASAGGCTDFDFEEIDLFEDISVDFEVARKLDNFGHGCSSIPFEWVDAGTQTALYGDEFAGRLRLPFEFPFYGESYGEVFISDNGYLNFLGPDQFNGFPVEIPSAGPPNAAIYALWQEMQVVGDGAIEYDTIGSEPNRAFVIEYADVSDATFEVKLWENGEIDFLYADAGDGSKAGIGIENAEGDDALQYSYLTDILEPNTAFRISEVPTGFVTGTVTDLNDGLPIPGATVEALGSGRSTTTDPDGVYRLRLLPGSYDLSISASGYATHEQPITIGIDDELVVDAALAAPIGSIDPTEITASVGLGETTEATVTLANSGSTPLSFTLRERPTGDEPPELPGIEGAPTRAPEWRVRAAPDSAPVAETTAIPPELLGAIIEDPEGDASGVDVTTVRAGADEAELTIEIELAPGSSVDDMAGYVFLDVDQDPTTGLPAEAMAGLPPQDVGMEYFVDLFAIHDPEPVVLLVDAFSFEIVAVTPARLDGQTLGFDVPLEAVGGDDGFVNTAMVIGDFFQPTDWAPDEGHGTIEPFSDAPWMAGSPETGSIEPGESAAITVSLGGAEVTAGTYTGNLVFLTSDPKTPTHSVAVTLTVALPDSFGSISGTISDAHDGSPLPATITVNAETAAGAYVATAVAGPDGAYTLFAPEGTWPGSVTLDGYVAADVEVTVTRGVDTPGVDVALHAEQPHATVEGGPFTFVLPAGQTGDGTLTIGNPGGHADLTFEIGEVNMDAGAAIAPARAPQSLPGGADPHARTTKDLALASGPDTRGVHVPGDVLGAWPTTGADLPWGVGFDGDVWLSDAFESGDLCGLVGGCTTHQYSASGEPGQVLDSSWAEAFVADMAYDAANGWLWQVHVGGANELFAVDPADGSIQAELTGSPWSDISQRGVAHDPATDTFYVGGWNEGVVYQVAGTSHPTPGETLGSCTPADPAISGLAWNPAFSLLWMATNSDTDTIYLIDPVTCETLQALDHPDPGLNGAGIEIDTLGNLWTVSQNGGTAYLIESGLPNFSDAPWLTVTPETGTVPSDGSAELEIQVDATGLEPGVYRAQVVALTNDPDNEAVAVPVTLVVPAYRQGLNAAGTAHTTADGTAYDADRAYAAGAHGYDGRSTGRRTRDEIAGTDEDALYRTMRQGMTAYRFDVPVAATYAVDLRFAEITATRAGARVFTVTIEGQPVLVNLDVFAEVGADAAYDRTFVVEVTDGRLDVEFGAQRGDQPFVSALLVTHRPDLGPAE